MALMFVFSSAHLRSQENKEEEKGPWKSSAFSGLKFRSIGPAFMSGRISDFAVNPCNPAEYYVAVASGGLWKTSNAGTTWESIFDSQKSYSMGCIAMDPNNHNVVWVGTGENNSQRSVSWGDGVYKTIDGGKSWKNMGLKNSEHIGKIIVDPRNSNAVYVAAQGPLWNAGGDRGLYKTTDGGENWEKVLEISENTGVTDVIFDPCNPDVLYAAAYQRRRHVFTLINGGPESAIYKSVDAGKTWKKLKTGLPSVDMGRIGLTVSPVKPYYIYAIIEAAEGKGGFFRSSDKGASWQKRNSYIANSPQYYMEIVADPQNPDRVYSLDTYSRVTNDGGKTFDRIPTKTRHVDDHALWIDPNNNQHLIIGGDGGIYETWDQGKKWKFVSNLPVTQFYRVAVDNSKPFYYVYGGTQDNNTQGGPSQTTSVSGIVNSDWFITNGGDGFEVQVDPKDPNIVYCQSQYGWLNRFDRKSGEVIGIKPFEGKNEEALRWNWDSPLLISPHKHTRLYFAANKVFKSEDRGNTWKPISDDLTRQIDRNKLPVMGKVWGMEAVSKNASTSPFGNIVSLTESPVKEGLIYVGTDDGLIQVTENMGLNWSQYGKFANVPETTYVSCLYASLHDENTVFAAFDNHKRGDFKPYLLKSQDKGKSWKSITSNLPGDEPVYTIRQDHENPNLLFVGTEYSVYFTVDGGEKWIKLSNGLPPIAIKDMEIQQRENDLVLGTFGRSFYVLDNYTPLRDVDEELFKKEAHIFPVKDALMYVKKRPLGWGKKGSQGDAFYTAKNPPFGATFTYYLKEDIKTIKQKRKEKEKELAKEDKTIPFPSHEKIRAEEDEMQPFLLFTVKDADGNIIRKLTKKPSKGINRITWDLRYATTNPAKKESKNKDESGIPALPGKYSVTMWKVVDGKITELAGPVEFNTVTLDNTTLPAENNEALYAFQEKVAELSRIAYGTLKTANDLSEKVAYMKNALKRSDIPHGELLNKLLSIEETNQGILRTLRGDETLSERNITTPPSVRGRISSIIWAMWNSTSAPTQTQKGNYKIAMEELRVEHSKLKKLLDEDVKAIETALEKADAPYTPGRLPEWDMK